MQLLYGTGFSAEVCKKAAPDLHFNVIEAMQTLVNQVRATRIHNDCALRLAFPHIFLLAPHTHTHAHTPTRAQSTNPTFAPELLASCKISDDLKEAADTMRSIALVVRTALLRACCRTRTKSHTHSRSPVEYCAHF